LSKFSPLKDVKNERLSWIVRWMDKWMINSFDLWNPISLNCYGGTFHKLERDKERKYKETLGIAI